MNPIVEVKHGSGGEAMQSFLRRDIIPLLGEDGHVAEVGLAEMDDSAVVGDLVFTTDCHTVQPLEFPGGDIGVLSVAGTVNDLAVMGAQPRALSLGLVIESGLDMELLRRVIASVGRAAREAGAPVVVGDTKVVESGGVRGMVTNTSGIGYKSPYLDHNLEVVRSFRDYPDRWTLDRAVGHQDVIVVSGSLARHGMAIMSVRRGVEFRSPIESDVRPLNTLIERALEVGGVTAMKDPTRGGLANLLNEWRDKTGLGISIEEDSLPVDDDVRAACEMMGMDPLEVGNEGVVVMAVVPDMAEQVLSALRTHPYGRDAAIVGRVERGLRRVVLETEVGGRRIIEPPIGDPVPRIC